MKLVECRSEHIKALKAMALRKNKFNDPKSTYDPNSVRFVTLDDDGEVLLGIQGYDTFYVSEMFINQNLSIIKRAKVFVWTVKEFLGIMRILGKRVWWITKKDHVFANDTYAKFNEGKEDRDKIKTVNYRKLRTWYYG